MQHENPTTIEYPDFQLGTILEISVLDSHWSRGKMLQLKHSLEKLINPFDILDEKQKRKETFDTQLDVIVKRIKEKEKEQKALRNSKDILAKDDGLELESQLNKLQINYNKYLEDLKEFDEKISDVKKKLNNFSEKFEFLSKNVKKKHRIIDDLINKQSKIDNELGILQNEINQLEGNISIDDDDINKYGRKIGAINNEINSLSQKTEKISARPKKVREKEMVIKLKTEAETLVSTIDIDENILKLYEGQKKKVEKYSKEIDIRNLEISELNNVQKNLFNSYRNDLSLYLKTINLEFKKLIRPYFGEIRISEINKIEETSLHIFAAFDKNPLKITKLSAGQTALTIISFLISLQTLRKTPLKVIDEFTQRLDSSHQKQVINMIVDHFERIKNENLEFYLPQFIIITPEISNLRINYPFNHICVSSTPPILEYKRQSEV
ncbi:Chromosome partition protein Smc [subsurface metagenome]